MPAQIVTSTRISHITQNGRKIKNYEISSTIVSFEVIGSYQISVYHFFEPYLTLINLKTGKMENVKDDIKSGHKEKQIFYFSQSKLTCIATSLF
jgi:hypothetical protein